LSDHCEKFGHDNIVVLQDKYHCLNRILKEMDKFHTNYYCAAQDLKFIFQKITLTAGYTTKKELKDAIIDWLEYWSEPVAQLESCDIVKIAAANLTGKNLDKNISRKLKNSGTSIITQRVRQAVELQLEKKY